MAHDRLDSRVPLRWYLGFVGTQTRAVQADTTREARALILKIYADRGYPLRGSELRVRRASKLDADWLADMGAEGPILHDLKASRF